MVRSSATSESSSSTKRRIPKEDHNLSTNFLNNVEKEINIFLASQGVNFDF
jgi:hypothetical protein